MSDNVKTPYRTLTDEAIIMRLGVLTPITAAMIADVMGTCYDAAYKYMRRRLALNTRSQTTRVFGWKQTTRVFGWKREGRLWMMYIPVGAEVYGARLEWITGDTTDE